MTATRKPGKIYIFDPVLFDRMQGNTSKVPAGTRVRKVQPYGCPRNGTMGMAYIERVDTGEFIGLAMLNSLTAVK